MEDEFNEPGHGDHNYTDVYVPVSVVNGDILVQASTDQTRFMAPSGSMAVGTFESDLGEATDFTATVVWSDGTSTAASVENVSSGYFGVTIPITSLHTADYTLEVVQSTLGVRCRVPR